MDAFHFLSVAVSRCRIALLCSVSYSVFADSAVAETDCAGYFEQSRNIAARRRSGRCPERNWSEYRDAPSGVQRPARLFANPYRAYPAELSRRRRFLWRINWVQKRPASFSIRIKSCCPAIRCLRTRRNTEYSFTEVRHESRVFRVVCSRRKIRACFLKSIGRTGVAINIRIRYRAGSSGSADGRQRQLSSHVYRTDPNTFLQPPPMLSQSGCGTSSTCSYSKTYYGAGRVFRHTANRLSRIRGQSCRRSASQSATNLDLAGLRAVANMPRSVALPLKINGYQSPATGTTKTHSGEGIQTEIGEIGTASANRSI